jgi:hypothetical protein
MSDRDTIIEAVAQNLFVQAYADFVEERDDGEDKSDLSRPGGGQDWYDYAPETSPAALKLARKAVAAVERMNGCRVTTLFKRATKACKDGRCEHRTHNLDGFGSDLGMMMTGTGVSWFDDHARFTVKVPLVEFNIMSRDEIKGGEGYVSERLGR